MRRAALALGAALALTGCKGNLDDSLAALAAAGQIQQDAPLIDTEQVTITAPPAKVWAILTNIQAWPQLDPNITQVAVGAVQSGAPFSWATGGMTIQSTIRAFTPNQLLAWNGHVLNYHAIHVWHLTPTADGGTLVTIQQSISGFMIGYFYSGAQMQQVNRIWLGDLKAAAEQP